MLQALVPEAGLKLIRRFTLRSTMMLKKTNGARNADEALRIILRSSPRMPKPYRVDRTVHGIRASRGHSH